MTEIAKKAFFFFSWEAVLSKKQHTVEFSGEETKLFGSYETWLESSFSCQLAEYEGKSSHDLHRQNKMGIKMNDCNFLCRKLLACNVMLTERAAGRKWPDRCGPASWMHYGTARVLPRVPHRSTWSRFWSTSVALVQVTYCQSLAFHRKVVGMPVLAFLTAPQGQLVGQADTTTGCTI